MTKQETERFLLKAPTKRIGVWCPTILAGVAAAT